jgi:hypothetical protein
MIYYTPTMTTNTCATGLNPQNLTIIIDPENPRLATVYANHPVIITALDAGCKNVGLISIIFITILNVQADQLFVKGLKVSNDQIRVNIQHFSIARLESGRPSYINGFLIQSRGNKLSGVIFLLI